MGWYQRRVHGVVNFTIFNFIGIKKKEIL